MTKTQQIHQDFRSSLNSSVLTVEAEPTVDTQKIELLNSIGFTASKTYQQEVQKTGTVQKIRQESKFINEIRAIEATYPQYRLIGLKAVMNLMKKYSLCFGQISDYTHMVPVQNALEIKEYNDLKIQRASMGPLGEIFNGGMFIVAPKAFFKRGLINIEGFMTSVQRDKVKKMSLEAFRMPTFATDPIVLNPVLSSSNELLFHVVTAWDVEANDDAVTTKRKAIEQSQN